MTRAATPRVHNSVSVESPYGLRSFTLILGNIVAATDPVLVVPTHANPAFPLSGEVLTAIQQRYNPAFELHEPLLAPGPGLGTFRLVDRGAFPGRELLLVRVPGRESIEASGASPLDVYRQALWTLFGSLAALELRGEQLESLALPLLGGTRGYAVRDLMRAILEASLNWLKVSRFMHAVNFYLLHRSDVEEWTAAMDDALGRRFVDSAQDELVHGLQHEIVVRLTSGHLGHLPEPAQQSLRSLRETLQHRRIPLDRVATEGRRLVECLVHELLKEQGVAQPRGTLAEKISELRRRNLTAPWIVSHFDALRIFGNQSVHLADDVSYQPPQLRSSDLVAILASIQRVLTFAATRD